MGFGRVLVSIVLPQAIRSVVAPLASVLIALTKNTTVASVIGVSEAALLMSTMLENRPDVVFVILAIFALGFILLTLPVGLLLGLVARKVEVKR
jgi:glutamate transport system permease protein